MRDRLGTMISIGSRVTYPVRRSSSMWMVDGIVAQLRGEPEKNTFEVLVSVTDAKPRWVGTQWLTVVPNVA